MRIAFIVGEFPVLSETFILSQITGLMDVGHEVNIIALSEPNERVVHPAVSEYDLLRRTRYAAVPKERLRYLAGTATRLLQNFRQDPSQALRSLNVFRHGLSALTFRLGYAISPFLGTDVEKYDIVQCHFGICGVYATMLRDFGAISGRLVTAFHGYDINVYPHQKGSLSYGDLFARGDLFTSNSDYTTQRLLELGCPPERLVKHPMGVDTMAFRNAAQERSRGNAIRLLTVARLVEVKGIEYSIRAVADLIRRQPELKLEYTIVGDGPLRGHLESITHQLGIAGSVHFAGWESQNEVINRYVAADIFLLTSIASSDGAVEAFGVVLLEAQAAGLPVVATRVGGIPEAVRDGVSAVLVPERNVGAIADALLRLINVPNWEQIGAEGQRFVAEKYDSRVLNRRLVRIYEELIS